MYYEFGTMVAIKKDASPFVNHEKGIGMPSIDVVGEIVGIHPSILSYTVRLSKYFTLVFSEDDIYGLPGWMSSRHDMFHKMMSPINQPFYYYGEFEDYVSRADGFAFIGDTKKKMIFRHEFKLPQIQSKKEINAMFGVMKFEYKKIIFNGPCTIILWKDSTKTIAKASDGEMFDPEKGVAICFMKKMLGHTETNKVLRKVHKQYEDYLLKNAMNIELIDDPKDLHTLEPTEYRLNFVNPIAHVSDINPNSVICIDQSAIEEVKKVEEENENNNLAVGSRCSTCEYFDKPMTKDPCCYCLSGDQYKKREEEQE